MNTVQRIPDFHPETGARIEAVETRKGEDATAVVADASEVLYSVIDTDSLDVEEDIQRFEEFERTGLAAPGDEIKYWIESWDTTSELPLPQPRKVISLPADDIAELGGGGGQSKR